jgi:hypothetical protein
MELLLMTDPFELAEALAPTIQAGLERQLWPRSPRVWREADTEWVVITVDDEIAGSEPGIVDLDGEIIDVLCEVVPPTAQVILFLREPANGALRAWFSRGRISDEEAAAGLRPLAGSGYEIDLKESRK